MSGRWLFASVLVTAALSAAPAAAQQSEGKTVTATGTGQARVHPTNRHSDASIVAAVDAARQAAIGDAFREAREYALDYAQTAARSSGARRLASGPGSRPSTAA